MATRRSKQQAHQPDRGGSRIRRSFTPEFKLEAVRLAALGDRPVSAVARELGIGPEMLRQWTRQATARAAKRERAEQDEQVRIDAILTKVSAKGMHTLTWLEKRTLKRATEHQRQRDVQTRRARRI